MLDDLTPLEKVVLALTAGTLVAVLVRLAMVLVPH